MATYSRTTGLDPADVIQRAVGFFGIDGIGLDVALRGDGCIRFVGVGGHVQVTVRRVLNETVVELETREWDFQVREFMRTLTRPKRPRGDVIPEPDLPAGAPNK